MRKVKIYLYALCLIIVTVAVILHPNAVLEASKRGLKMWWEIVFPSLLPFFILSEILIAFGLVAFIGVLLEPLMRPLFNVPGQGGFVWAMGLVSGFPAGAKLTARLRQEKQLTKIEAERLVSFTNSSNPLFIIAAISIGFFENKYLGLLLAICHYLANISVGLIMRFWNKQDDYRHNSQARPSIGRAFEALYLAKEKEKRPFGKILGDAVTRSVETLLLIGGFIILFSVLNQVLSIIHFSDLIAKVIELVLYFFTIDTNLSLPVVAGLFEITLGGKLISSIHSASLFEQLIVTSFILGFSGFSVQAQVASILAETDISFKPFFIGRILQGCFAAFFTVVLFKPLYLNLHSTNEIPTFLHNTTVFVTNLNILKVGPVFTILFLILYIIIYGKRVLNDLSKKS
ncbi:sporulation integral membrane protein YlbJ [Bacillus carboniphilus]|uniref:Sporulation integral membrane protein YlbJ n=1 Tax=Bacillus carboniphilus TaxID=86663 RepID=A0ABY9JW56_9BACI|nr:sporulation integral membrane protein YlbJ [Bacillus carboniphilus]WLR43641.1 sporulation integral membrane protein YlbJ [Bacillus carboniphilus]